MSTHAPHHDESPSTENQVAEWLKLYGRPLLYGLVATILILVAVFRWTEKVQSDAYRDFISAEAQMLHLEQSSSASPEAMLALESILKKHSELRPKYEGRIAHYFIKDGDVGGASTLLESSLQRSQASNGSLHHAYSKNTLQVVARSYDSALSAALELQSDLDALEAPPATLLTFNLLRIAILYQELDNKEAEKLAWQRFKDRSPWLVEGSQFSGELRALHDHFAQKTIKLQDYIRSREVELL